MADEGYCCECKCDVDKTRIPITRIDGHDACAVCFEMLNAINSNPHFLKAHYEYCNRKAKLDRLKPGNTEKDDD